MKFFQKATSKNEGWLSVSVNNIILMSYTSLRYVKNIATHSKKGIIRCTV